MGVSLQWQLANGSHAAVGCNDEQWHSGMVCHCNAMTVRSTLAGLGVAKVLVDREVWLDPLSLICRDDGSPSTKLRVQSEVCGSKWFRH